jgi:hypothetical protein
LAKKNKLDAVTTAINICIAHGTKLTPIIPPNILPDELASYVFGTLGSYSQDPVELSGHHPLQSCKEGLTCIDGVSAFQVTVAFAMIKHLDPGLENLSTLLEKPSSGAVIVSVLFYLYMNAPELINDDTLKLLSKNIPHAERILGALLILYKVHPKHISNEVFKLLAEDDYHIWVTVDALDTLYELDSTFVKDKIFVEQNTPHQWYLVRALAILSQADFTLVNEKNINLLVENARYGADILGTLGILLETKASLINEENLNLLIKNAPNVQVTVYIAEALHRLYTAGLLNDENHSLIMQNPQDAWTIADVLTTVHFLDPSLIDDKYRQELVKNPLKEWLRVCHPRPPLEPIDPIVYRGPFATSQARHQEPVVSSSPAPS